MPLALGWVSRVSLLPVENLWQGWAGLQVCRHSCRAFHPSEFRFLPCLCVSADCVIVRVEKAKETKIKVYTVWRQ